MKKIFSLFVLSILVFTLVAGCSAPPNSAAASGSDGLQSAAVSSEEPAASSEAPAAADERYLDDPSIGLRFLLPDAWYSAMYENGNITVSSYQYGFSFDYLSEGAMEALQKLIGDPGLPDDEADYTLEQKQLAETYRKGVVPLCAITFEKKGKRDEELRSMYPEEKVLGEKNGTTYTLLTNPGIDLSALPEKEQDTCRALIAATADFTKDMTLSGVPERGGLDSALSFSSKTIGGQDIDSSVFQDNKLTMVNIWATWCGPCVNELPELQKLYENLPEGVGMLGICTDGADEAEMAKKILEKAGVKYDNVAANEEMTSGFLANIQAYPTTIFVDSEGNIVGDPYEGAPSSDVEGTYLAEIQKRLDLLGQ